MTCKFVTVRPLLVSPGRLVPLTCQWKLKGTAGRQIAVSFTLSPKLTEAGLADTWTTVKIALAFVAAPTPLATVTVYVPPLATARLVNTRKGPVAPVI